MFGSLDLPAWWLLALALPVLLFGEAIYKRVHVLERYSIPVPVVGGLLVCFLVLMLNLTGVLALKLETKVDAPWWTWLVTTQQDWLKHPAKAVNTPFLIGFFTCIGLNASWSVVRKGTGPIVIFLAISTVLAALQNVVGVGIAKAIGAHPLLGVICGSLSQTGGMGTSMGFAETLIHAGYRPAETMGVSASTFGLIMGSLVGGPIAMRLIRKHNLKPAVLSPRDEARAHRAEEAVAEQLEHEPGILSVLKALARRAKSTLLHLLLLACLFKAGAFLSYEFQRAGMVFPTYMGSLMIGLVLRNVLDLFGKRWIDTHTVDLIGGAFLAIFLSMSMMSLNLLEIKGDALPMFAILAGQVVLIYLFTTYVTFPCMGRDYESAVMVTGQIGFAHGATANAVANMESITRKMGPAPRAFIIIPIVGGMFIDITNAFIITWFINHFKT